jgi:hypothetical protein
VQARFEPSPDRERLTSAPLHVLVAEYPETLAVLRDLGVDLSLDGGDPIPALALDPEPVVWALLDATAWRDGGPE